MLLGKLGMPGYTPADPSQIVDGQSALANGVAGLGTWFATDNLTLFATLGYIDAQINEILSGGVNVADAFVTQNTPELQGQISANYNYDLGADRGEGGRASTVQASTPDQRFFADL